MSENVYDYAYELERALRESDQFVKLKELYADVNNDESSKRMFDNFRALQLKLQEKQMTGQNITEEEVANAQKSAALIEQDPKISQLLQAEQNMSMTINELNKIIMNPLAELYRNEEQ